MRKALKWVGIVVGVLAAVVIVLIIGALIYGQVSFKKSYANRSLYEITADTSPKALLVGSILSKL